MCGVAFSDECGLVVWCGMAGLKLPVLDPAAQALQANLMAVEDEEIKLLSQWQWRMDVGKLSVRPAVACPPPACGAQALWVWVAVLHHAFMVVFIHRDRVSPPNELLCLSKCVRLFADIAACGSLSCTPSFTPLSQPRRRRRLLLSLMSSLTCVLLCVLLCFVVRAEAHPSGGDGFPGCGWPRLVA